MNIDDFFDGFLKQKECKSLNKYLTQEMQQSAGEDLISQMINVFDGAEENALNWFYTPLIALGGKRPYDICKEDKHELVKTILYHIEYGIYS